MKPQAPMLACKVDLDKIKYPVAVSPKIDGIRAKVYDGKVYSRKLKPLPNGFIQHLFMMNRHRIPNGLDGEIVVGNPYGEGVFQRTSSGVMSRSGRPLFTYYVFDIDGPHGYIDRFGKWKSDVSFIQPLDQNVVSDYQTLLQLERRFLRQGYEGLIGRSLDGVYKHGRSTMKEGLLWKLVRFDTDEATIIGFKEQMHNGNPAEVDNLGHTKRSTRKIGKSPVGILGAFTVESENYRDVFDVGTGFTAAQRRELWRHRKALVGNIIRFKHKPIGAVDVPRHPVFQGFREAIDL